MYPLVLALAFGPLLGGAELVVRGAEGIARGLGIPPLVVGLTILAFGTSAPELVINLSAALTGSSQIALGNILGSNIFNIAGLLGVLALCRNLPVGRSTTWAEIPLAIVSALLLLIVTADGIIRRGEGVVLLLLFGGFLVYVGILSRRSREPLLEGQHSISDPESSCPREKTSWLGATLILAGGLTLLTVGGRGVVLGATGTARLMGLPEYIIAASIVAIGTSLPELATGIAALRRGVPDLAIGNAVGSNIFNVLLVIGATALVTPVEAVPRPLDHGVHLLSTGLLFLFVFTGRKSTGHSGASPGKGALGQIERPEGAILLGLYLIYGIALFLTA
ncbi:cation:H+ antiporter [Alkalispirochaeta americana]|uniref:Cation:H+ antiporter n=1 Tax=Alkalispirochaeta americana TaxID=159291 RepID=A0A1N6TJN3_9SPIO|nr:calcium/sodium antiporter [Alkalispirochaeta americana]SIQ53543.1 cation:H+ antiporter [Alkalispirochaeta americana]